MVADNGPNRSGSPEALLERAQAAGKTVTRFMQGDYRQFAEAARRLPPEHSQKPAAVTYHSLSMARASFFPRLPGTAAAGHLLLGYPDGAAVIAVEGTAEHGESFGGSLVPELGRFSSYSLDFLSISTGYYFHAAIIDSVGSLQVNGIEITDDTFTDEIVCVYEDLADRLQPLVDGVLTG